MIPAAEFEARRSALRDRLAALDLPGALVFGRGGGTFDRHGDIVYLTNHYPAMPYLPDLPQTWTAKGHAVLVLPTSGDPVLGVDNPDFALDEVVVEHVEVGNDVVGLSVRLAASKGLTGRVGVIGWDTLPALSAERLRRELPEFEPVDCGAEVAALRFVKSSAELAVIREASAVAVDAMALMLDALDPGLTEAEIVAAGAAEIVRRGARIQYAAVASGAFSPLYVRRPITGYDALRRLDAGDLVHLDLLLTFEGYYADFQRSAVAGAPAGKRSSGLIAAAKAGVEMAIGAVRPGALAEDVAHAGEAYKAELGLGREFGLVHPPGWEHRPPSVGDIDYDFWGHGLGLGLEAPFLRAGDRTVLEPGVVLAVEQFLVQQDVGGASWEEELIVTETGCEVLTASV
jgi:Xaa-Pro aminopeptidase